jgi:glutathione synthase/RimK-type ligase-like ATP-grasp enzyme
MSLKAKVFPYKLGSKSAKALAEGLNTLKVRAVGNYYHRATHLLINWGASVTPSWFNHTGKYLNHPTAVAKAANKLSAFNELFNSDVQIPEYTTDRAKAKSWLQDRKVVVARGTLTGHSGRGITIYDSFSADDIDSLEGAPLYTKHVRHKREFRIHVLNGQVIDATEKKKRDGFEADNFVRSHLKGWVFCRDRIIIPEDVKHQAIKAVKALDLDFGAVDIGYREREDKAFVFEVNTAPGLEGTTLTKYIEAFKLCLA